MDKQSIKLMHIVLSLNTGGLERVVINLLKGMDQNVYNLYLCCLEEPGILIHEAEKIGVKVLTLNKKKAGIDYKSIFNLAKALKEYKIDIVHTHNPGSHFYGAIAGKIAKVPVIINTKHGRNPSYSRWNLIQKKLLSYITDKIVAVSEDARKMAIEIEKIPHRKVTTILNCIDIDKYNVKVDKELKRQELGISKDDFVIGIVARLSPEKDHNTLLDAFRHVLDKSGQNVKLVIVGDGILKEELKQKSRILSITDNTIFLGERHDVPELLATFDLFVLPSLTEGISLTLLEAMSAGLPIVATNVGGNPEIVIDNKSGMIVPPQNINSMANAIIRIMSDKDTAKQMGLAGKIRAQERFSIEAMVSQYEQLYRDILNLKNDFIRLKRQKK